MNQYKMKHITLKESKHINTKDYKWYNLAAKN